MSPGSVSFRGWHAPCNKNARPAGRRLRPLPLLPIVGAPGAAFFMTVDWQSLLALNVPLLEIVVRGSAIYWFLFVLFRLLVRRELGAVGMADLLVLVIIADAAQNAMAGEYTTITEGMVLIATVMGWNVFIDGLVYRFPFARRLLRSARFASSTTGEFCSTTCARNFSPKMSCARSCAKRGFAILPRSSAPTSKPMAS